MDYKLQWKIERRIGVPYIPSAHSVRLTPYPAVDFVNPGCDAKLYQFYVPIHANAGLHVINKKVDSASMLQGIEDSDKQKEQSGTGIIEKDDTSVDPIQFNNEKKEKLGETVQNNFLHPKPVETGRLFIKEQKSEKVNKKVELGGGNKETRDQNKKEIKKEKALSSKIKHSFFVI